jgi:uncharacterized protein YdaU (DUF1376 family)
MAEFPAMPLWTDRWLADTTHLNATEQGAFFLLVIIMWRAKDQRLPDDDRLLARYARLSTGQWKRLKPTLSEFFTVENGWWLNKTVSSEFDFVRQQRQRQSNNAKSRYLKNKETLSATAEPRQSHSPAPTPTPTPKRKRESKDSRAFDAFWTAYPKRLGKKAAAAKFSAAVKSGVSSQQIISGAERYAEHTKITRTEARFIKHPTTWLNQGCWDDELKSENHTERRRADDRFEQIMGISSSGQPASERGMVEVSGQDVPEHILGQRAIGNRG